MNSDYNKVLEQFWKLACTIEIFVNSLYLSFSTYLSSQLQCIHNEVCCSFECQTDTYFESRIWFSAWRTIPRIFLYKILVHSGPNVTILQLSSHSLLPDLPPILGTEESDFVSQQHRAMSWASLLPTAVPHEKKYLDNASRYAFPNTKMQFSKVSPIKTFSFEPSPNHSSAGSILSTEQHQAYSYSPQGCGKPPNKGKTTAHGKTMPSRC